MAVMVIRRIKFYKILLLLSVSFYSLHSVADIEQEIAEAYSTGNYELLFNLFQKQAIAGDVSAMYNVGVSYIKGKGVNQDKKEAYKWLEKAANGNHVKAQELMGAVYFLGDDIEQDYIKSLYWYKRAANQNSVGAQELVGSMCFNGLGTLSD